jgi:uncharacterized membrane protein YozB (DUF420 family)
MYWLALFPTKGFLGTDAPFDADLNLVMQAIMGVALIAGVILAKHKRYTAHGICQSTILLLNLVMIAFVMWPSFQQQVEPKLPRTLDRRYYAVATIHGLLGAAAELLGSYIVIVAGTSALPQRLRFKNWKRWMRTELILWYVVVFTGIGTYYIWYIAPFR